jgi:hypothetical protein
MKNRTVVWFNSISEKKEIITARVNEKGVFVSKKVDVTDTALTAVAECLLKTDESLLFEYKGERYKLQVVKISEDEKK